MPSILDRLLGKKEEKKAETPTQKVSEEAARARREQLDRDRQYAEDARKKADESEKQRLAAIEAQKQAAAKAAAGLQQFRAQAETVVHPQAQAAATQRTYVVKSGDSLSKIAKELYGDAKRWPDIYAANKALIGENPNLIQPGQKLIIP